MSEKPTGYQMPGRGGSLGQCALCGKPFLREILLRLTVPVVHCSNLKGDPDLPMHEACLEIAEKAKTWMDFPPGPLRNAFEKASK